MNRRQILNIEIEYIVKDLSNGIRDLQTLIYNSKKRRLISHNSRNIWEDKCLRPAEIIYKNKSASDTKIE